MDLRVFLKLDGSGFQQGITQARASVNNFAEQTLGGIKGQIAAAFTVGALVQFSRKTIEFASHMRDVADALGVNVEWLQRMANSAAQAGANVDDLSRFMLAMNRNRIEAGEKPGGEKAQAFRRLGVSGSDLQLPTQELFNKIAEAFRGGSTAALEADVQEIGDKASRQLLAAFANGMQEVGPVMSEELIDQLDTLDDAFYSLKITLMTEFAPAIIKVTGGLKTFINQFSQVGTIFGSLTSNAHFNLWDVLDAFTKGDKKAIERIRKGVSEMRRQVVAQDSEQKNAEDAADIANRDARARRRERERRKFEITTDKKDAAPLAEKGAKTPSDSLVQVGNFLGASRASLDGIARETNRILQEHTKLLSSINNAVSNRAGGSLGVPPVL